LPGSPSSTPKKLEVARRADLGYITNHEQKQKGSCPETPAQEKEAQAEKEGSGKSQKR
jgi:hypothetical protein